METESLWRDKRVLVVDDSATSRTLMGELLRELPVEIDFAASSEDFHRRVGESDYDLVLLDFRLPGTNGLELLRQLRSGDLSVTVVLITGKGEVSTATEAVAEGADGYIEKSHLRQGPAAFRLALEKAILQRARLLDQQELSNLKDEFHAVIMHDLRAPAAATSVALRMYQEQPRPELLESAQRSLDHLFDRLDRYLDFTRMEGLAWQMKTSACHVGELMEEVVAQVLPLARQKDQSLEMDPDPNTPLMNWDAHWMIRALENLLINAVKYTPFGGAIQLGWRTLEGELQLWVRDNGPGIPPAQQSRLFQRYFRVQSGGREKGAGLGLLIAKNVVQAHGGQIFLESPGRAGEGATFRLHFSRT